MSAIGDFFNKILSVFSTFGISDALDILFVAVIIYGCIRIIRETRAMQLAKGILLLLVMYGIVNLLHMEASSFIFKSIFSNILLLAAILFSPELRNILEQVGKGATGKSLKTIIHPGVAIDVAEIGDCIEATCKACSDMSDQHVGALIVFENETMLGDIIASGTELHAKASRQLIENVFFPKSPLHDGALVIRDGRLYAAGCILPLTKKSVSSALGTRHRAGIGLTEQSDAVVVIVSEETGAISVAENGVLKSGFTRESLHQLLTKRLITASEETTIGKVARKIPFLKRHHKDDGKEKDNAQKSLEEPTEKDITEESEQRH